MPKAVNTYIDVKKETFAKLGCFNTIMDSDSLFFINFLRLKNTNVPELKTAYDKIKKFFRQICLLLETSKNINDRFFREAYKLLNMSEFQEICLGYSRKGTSGSGSGHKLKMQILKTGKQIIDAGIKEPEIFELVGLFEEKIGPDRISDFIGRVIKDELVSYSINIITELGINNINITETGLLFNEYNKKELILLPLDIIHELPIAKDWDDIERVCFEISSIREEINQQIGIEWKEYTSSEKKAFLKSLLLREPRLLRKIIEDYRNFYLDEYDFKLDPSGEATWYPVAKEYSKKYPLKFSLLEIKSKNDAVSIVLSICKKFKDLIENNGLNEVLYSDEGKPRKERISQKLFHGISESYCEANKLDVSPEVNSGRGALDFKFSIGYDIKIIVEVKLTTNSRLKHGYAAQLKEYQKAEKYSYPIYLVIDNEGKSDHLKELIDRHRQNKKNKIVCPDLIIVDAKRRATASKI